MDFCHFKSTLLNSLKICEGSALMHTKSAGP
jgi:hypothetical protein